MGLFAFWLQGKAIGSHFCESWGHIPSAMFGVRDVSNLIMADSSNAFPKVHPLEFWMQPHNIERRQQRT